MTVNFGELLQQSAGAFAPVPQGQYDVVISSAEATKSSTGKTMFKVKYKIVGGPNNDRQVFNNVTLSPENPNALNYFFRDMKNMGLTQEFFAASPSPDSVASALLGKRCRIQVNHREYNGEMRDNVEKILPSVGGPATPAAPSVPSAPPAAPAAAAPVPTVPAVPQAAAPAPPPAIPAPANPAPSEEAPAPAAAPPAPPF